MFINLTDREGTTTEVTVVASEERHIAMGTTASADHIHVTWVELASDVPVAFPQTYQFELPDGRLLEANVALCVELPSGGFHVSAVLPGASPFVASDEEALQGIV